MGPSPTIPTSFVPKQPVKSAARFTKSGGNTFLMFSLFALGLSVVSAAGVLGYGEYLKGVDKTKSAALAAAQTSVSSEEVEEFVRSRDRFEAATGILDGHIELSNFFDLLESLTLVNVRYGSFIFGTLEDGTAEIKLSGQARSFNALAAQSAVFSSNPNIKRAIFSGIDVDDDGAVSFDLDAQLEADLLVFAVEGQQQTEDPSSSTEPSVPVVPVSDTSSLPSTTTAPTTPTPSVPSTPVTPTQL